MNAPLLFDPGTSLAQALVGAAAYRDGQDSLAAVHFAAVADRAKADGKHGIALNARRWEGNALLWAGRIGEALASLIPVATERDPLANVEAVYGAMTDLVMINLFHGSVARIDALIADASAYLETIQCERWGHRLVLHRAIKSCRRGDFVLARTLALKAMKDRASCPDGPQYAEYSHLRWILTPAFYLGDLAAVEEALLMAECQPRCWTTDEQTWHWMHLQVHRLRRREGLMSEAMEEHALAAARIEAVAHPKEPIFDLGRGLILCGRLEQAAALNWQKADNWPFERALFEFDLEFNRLLAADGRVPVDLDLDPAPGVPPSSSTRVLPFEQLAGAMERMRTAATHESARLESSYPFARVRRRLDWQQAQFPLPSGQA